MEVLGIIKNETTPKITTGETMFTITGSDCHRGGGTQLSYQKVTGSLMANSHPGSYCGQDAYNDMFVVENSNGLETLGWQRSDRNSICEKCGGGVSVCRTKITLMP